MILPIFIHVTPIREVKTMMINCSLVESMARERYHDAYAANPETMLDVTAIRVQSGVIYYVAETLEQLREQAEKAVSQQIHQGAVTIGRYRSTL